MTEDDQLLGRNLTINKDRLWASLMEWPALAPVSQVATTDRH